MSKRQKEPKKEEEKNSQNVANSIQFEKKCIRISEFIEHKGFVALFLFLFSFGAFAFSLKNDFVWDDIPRIKKSSYSLKASKITYKLLIPWIKEKNKGSHYRPIMLISWIIDNEMWGASPFGFHLSNDIFHSISTVLFYFMVLIVLGEFRVERKESIAFLSSLFFALHPIHVESVSWVAGRADLLCGMFFFPAFIFYILSYRRLWLLIFAAICFYLSLLSKEIAVAFPILALGFDLISRRFASRKNILRYTVCVFLILIYFYLRERGFATIPNFFREAVRQSAQDGVQTWGVLGVLKVILGSYLFYIKNLFFPFNPNPFITTVPLGFFYLVSSILVILLLCVIGFISIRKREGITAFSIFWIFTTLGPPSIVSIFLIAATPLAERFLYIPSAGYCLLMGNLVLKAGKRIKAQKIAWAFGFLLCLLYLFFTIKAQSVWKNNLSLWEYALKKSPNNAPLHINYGEALLLAGKTDEAIREFLVIFEPRVKSGKVRRAFAANNIGVAYAYKKDHDNAEKWLNISISYHPTFKTYHLLGLIFFEKGKSTNSVSDYRKAEEYLKRALKIRSSDGSCNLYLAKVYIELGDREKARKHARKALRSRLSKPLAKEARKILEIMDN